MKTVSTTSSPLFLLLLSTSLYSGILLADATVITNVQGDEIFISSEENPKPALRDNSSLSNFNPGEATIKNAEKKFSTPSINAMPAYIPGSSPVYNSGEGIMPKGYREERLSKIPDNESISSNSNQNAVPHIERDDLWQRIKNGYAMQDSTSPLVKNHEDWYSSRPDYVKRMVERSQRYLFHVVEEVEKRGMPTEIALLPMIESAYNPKAYSTSRASGIWQFVPATGKYFGLKQNWWFDNRRNITFATDAALTYLEKLHAMFGAWDLALAAYNAGEGTVSRAIERNRRLGLPTDYESLNLPPETRNYVPKLQAVKNLMTNPGNYGLNIQTIANTPYFAKVTAPAQIDAHLAARLAEISDEEFLALNPSFNRPVITGDNKNLELLLPILAAQTFRTNLENYNKPLVSWKTYFAKKGERLQKIADKFGIHVSKLRDVNDLPAQSKIKKTAPILVPTGQRTEFKTNSGAKENKITGIGVSGADVTGATLKEMEAELASDPDYRGADMLLANQVEHASESEPTLQNEPNLPRSVTHKVKKGEGMAAIAKQYGVSVKQIMVTNALKTTRVKVGQLLKINPAQQNAAGASKVKSAGNVQTYIVKRGDTLHSIARKFNVALTDLKRWNKNLGTNIQPGKRLMIKQSDEG